MMNSTSDYLRVLPSKSPYKVPYSHEVFGSLSKGIDSFSDSFIMGAVKVSKPCVSAVCFVHEMTKVYS